MVKWADVNLHWADVNSLSVEVGYKNGKRFILLNGTRYTEESIRANRPRFIQIDGTRIHLFGIDFIIKVDSPARYNRWGMESSLKQSDAEYKTWSAIEKLDRTYFAEVLGYEKNRFIVFRRYPEVDDMNPVGQKIAKRHITKINKLLNKYDLSDIDTDDYLGYDETHNWCLVDGKPLIFDYGFS